ncbi:hypothetical protein JOD64_003796 [Micromonospora luteifusca]|uniref:Uncharacterized protein n=1 Tax=Micromonospora luteifusca TaxID=709860 RepID=A0ABS2LY41_9ACTN|nr:hypothetical protein [Micromonospora luteifusca]MBM7492574.1 hypothetical protein [Micromonospora luteifusca]
MIALSRCRSSPPRKIDERHGVPRGTKVKSKGDGWRTRIDAPRTAGFVTLRTTARDARGNSVEQSITRAFGLR